MSDRRLALAADLDALLATRRDGHGMPRAFYHDDALYAAEMRSDLAAAAGSSPGSRSRSRIPATT